jgi:O-antigen/teichoic acid export membrane protein
MLRSLLQLLIGRGFSSILQIICISVIGQHLGPVGFGSLMAARTVWLLASGPIAGSVDMLIVRDISCSGLFSRSTLYSFIWQKTLYSLVFLFLVLILNVGFRWVDNTWILVATVGCLFGPALSPVAVFQGLERFGLVSVANALESGALLGFILLIIHLKLGLTAAGIAFSMSALAGAILVYGFVVRLPDNPKLTRLESGSPKFIVSWLILYQISVTIYSLFDVIIINRFVGPHDAGIYSAAQRILWIGVTFQALFAQVALPKLIRLENQGSNIENKDIKRIGIVIIFGATFVFVFHSLADLLVYKLYGESFKEAAGLLKILVISLFFVFCQSILVPLLLARKNDKVLALICCFAAIVSLAGNLILSTKFGAIGVALVRVLVDFIVLVSLIIAVYKIENKNYA